MIKPIRILYDIYNYIPYNVAISSIKIMQYHLQKMLNARKKHKVNVRLFVQCEFLNIVNCIIDLEMAITMDIFNFNFLRKP